MWIALDAQVYFIADRTIRSPQGECGVVADHGIGCQQQRCFCTQPWSHRDVGGDVHRSQDAPVPHPTQDPTRHPTRPSLRCREQHPIPRACAALNNIPPLWRNRAYSVAVHPQAATTRGDWLAAGSASRGIRLRMVGWRQPHLTTQRTASRISRVNGRLTVLRDSASRGWVVGWWISRGGAAAARLCREVASTRGVWLGCGSASRGIRSRHVRRRQPRLTTQRAADRIPRLGGWGVREHERAGPCAEHERASRTG